MTDNYDDWLDAYRDAKEGVCELCGGTLWVDADDTLTAMDNHLRVSYAHEDCYLETQEDPSNKLYGRGPNDGF